MNKNRTPTLDQLITLIQIAETGSFTAAAKKLNKALSVVSYSISALEEQLGLKLFDRTGTRKPRLTEAGNVVLTEARLICSGVDGLRSRVTGMLQGLEGELHVAFDSLLSAARVVDAITAFSQTFPTVSLYLHVETLGAVAGLVLDKKASIGISGRRGASSDALQRVGVGSLRMLPVASPAHPLAAKVNLPGAAREHLQLVVYDRSPLTQGENYSVVARRTWRLGDLNAKHMLLRGGIGWGVMPLAAVTEDLAAARLVSLTLPELPPFDYVLDAVYRKDTPPGPAASWLIEHIKQQPCD